VTLVLVVGFTLLGSLISVLLAATVLAVRPSILEKALPRLIGFSTGTLLAVALFAMLPHAARTLPFPGLAYAMLAGFVLLLVLEKLLLWRHCHKDSCDIHAGAGPLLLVGDSIHNFVDGVVIAGAFLESDALGVAAALSTIAHEVPQEIGEFLVYLRSGYTRRRALSLNCVSSLAAVAGAVLGYFVFSGMSSVLPVLLAAAAAGFLYVALADLIPASRGRMSPIEALLDLLFLVSGVGVILLVSHSH
jgi:zinc and cadmium transporter